MIDDLLQGHKSNALGPNGFPIGIDFVSYGHDSILPTALCLSVSAPDLQHRALPDFIITDETRLDEF
jgi:hypothetical protein